MKSVISRESEFTCSMCSWKCSSSYSSRSMVVVKLCLILFIILSASTSCNAKPKRSHPLEKQQELPECVDELSTCGYLQLNMMGISSQPICRCKGNVLCPLVWDPLDGRTVMHGFDQYKYCGRAPKLSICGRDEVVYSSHVEMSMITMDTMISTHRVHCLCPANYLYIRNSTKFHDFDDGVSLIGTSYQCKPPPRCDLKDVCMAITESAHSSFITRNCACPVGMFCPNDVRLTSERVELDKGAYYSMRCV